MERVVMGEGRGWESRDKRKISIVYSFSVQRIFNFYLTAINPERKILHIAKKGSVVFFTV